MYSQDRPLRISSSHTAPNPKRPLPCWNSGSRLKPLKRDRVQRLFSWYCNTVVLYCFFKIGWSKKVLEGNFSQFQVIEVKGEVRGEGRRTRGPDFVSDTVVRWAQQPFWRRKYENCRWGVSFGWSACVLLRCGRKDGTPICHGNYR